MNNLAVPMTIVPQTTPLPEPAESRPDSGPSEPDGPDPAPGRPASSAHPSGPKSPSRVAVVDNNTSDDDDDDDPALPQPKLRLEIRDLGRAGASEFLAAVNASAVLAKAVRRVQRQLYQSPPPPPSAPGAASQARRRRWHCPPTRSVTLVLRDMGGVAYTVGTELDPSHHKEVHLSLGYVAGVRPSSRLAAELEGVLTHELVHCYQWNGLGTCPGGLVEGVADWVRLRCRLGPPHWRREAGAGWDGGYQHTAYFLDYLEGRFGEGTVRRINERLREHRYEEREFWTGLFGRPVGELWEAYVDKLKRDDELAADKEKEKQGDTTDHATQT